jgi:hypothetical protein
MGPDVGGCRSVQKTLQLFLHFPPEIPHHVRTFFLAVRIHAGCGSSNDPCGRNIMIRFFSRSASLIGLCMLALAIGCGGSSKNKSNCDGPCADASKDGSGDVKKDGGTDVVTPLDARTDGLLPDGIAPQSDGATPDAGADVFVPTPDAQPVTPDTAGDTSPTPLSDALVPDAVTPDTQRDTTPVLPDTATDTRDAPVNLDVAVDAAADVGIDAPAIDAAGDANDDGLDADDASDADIDTI